ncbi:MAG: hypothetical protein JXR68_05645 [Bacteroidales bacterium]|nr:hypothetical protein [Bacteroidales bacterium]
MNILKHILIVVVVLLFIFTPFLKHSSIFYNPVVTIANVDYKKETPKDYQVYVEYEYNNIKYQQFFSQEFINKYKHTVKVAFQKNNPQNVIIFSFPFLFFQYYMSIPFVFLLIIFALYFTDKQTFKKIEF